MPRLVSMVGLTPGVTHTSLCLLSRRGYHIGEVVLIGTQPNILEEAARIAVECPCPSGTRKPDVRVRKVVLGFPDIRDEMDLNRLGKVLRNVLEADDIVDITGGRKIMSAWAAIVAINVGAHVVASIVPKEEIDRANSATSTCGKTVEKASLVWLA